jgi:hypothetical protein
MKPLNCAQASKKIVIFFSSLGAALAAHLNGASRLAPSTDML